MIAKTMYYSPTATDTSAEIINKLTSTSDKLALELVLKIPGTKCL